MYSCLHGHEAHQRPAEAHRVAERLAFAHGDVGVVFTGRTQNGK
jgi:hypothetical protein